MIVHGGGRVDPANARSVLCLPHADGRSAFWADGGRASALFGSTHCRRLALGLLSMLLILPAGL